MNRNLVGGILGRFSIKNTHLVPICLQTWLPQTILVSESSSLKPLGKMNWNLVGSNYGRSSIKIAHFVPIRYQTWLPQTILVSDGWFLKKSSPLKLLGQMNWNLVGSIYGMSSIKIAHFVPIRSDCLISNKSPLKPLGQMNRNLVGSILGRFSIKITHLIPICLQTWPPQTILVSDWQI
jgi:uncharacterized membrane protein YuzA (DUF378 family)